MRLDFTFDPNSTSPLPAMELISAIDGKYPLRSLDGIRNPKALYNISVRETVSIATDLVDSILSISDDKENFSKNFLSSGQIMSQTKLFILAVEQHIDACEKIISSFAPDDKKAGKMNREFRSSLGFYYKHVCVQANHIKHRHSQIRPLCLVSDVGHVPGYFLESGTGDKSAGPDPIIHNNGNTAFSLNREIKKFCIGMAFTSRCLSSIVKKI